MYPYCGNMPSEAPGLWELLASDMMGRQVGQPGLMICRGNRKAGLVVTAPAQEMLIGSAI